MAGEGVQEEVKGEQPDHARDYDEEKLRMKQPRL